MAVRREVVRYTVEGFVLHHGFSFGDLGHSDELPIYLSLRKVREVVYEALSLL